MKSARPGRPAALAPALALLVSACSLPYGALGPEAGRVLNTTYEKHLARAEAGDAESQNVVGFMLFHGEGVAQNRDRARTWFEEAAQQGNPRALRNLAAMRAMGEARRGGAPEATLAAQRGAGGVEARTRGETLYLKFCSGCHGFNGIAAYVHSPSFALGESLDKSDAELMRSLLRGTGEMPNWDDKLSREDLAQVLAFVRTLRVAYEAGVRETLRGPPPYFFLFGPMKPKS